MLRVRVRLYFGGTCLWVLLVIAFNMLSPVFNIVTRLQCRSMDPRLWYLLEYDLIYLRYKFHPSTPSSLIARAFYKASPIN